MFATMFAKALSTTQCTVPAITERKTGRTKKVEVCFLPNATLKTLSLQPNDAEMLNKKKNHIKYVHKILFL